MPAWAARQRLTDLVWIVENLHLLSLLAYEGYLIHGRGALIIDTSGRAAGVGHPCGFLAQEDIDSFCGEKERCQVARYDPEREMVTVLLKRDGGCSTYRIDLPGSFAGR